MAQTCGQEQVGGTRVDMALLCYNKGCGHKFDAAHNKDDSCLFHPGIPIFHDALKGWSCCRKRTTDFSEFLSIKGCTRGRHSNQKPCEVSSDKAGSKKANGQEIIYQGPKSCEKLQRERPSSEEAKTKLPLKVAPSLAEELHKLDMNQRAEKDTKESQDVIQGTRCKNSGCKRVYRGPETDLEVCTQHPGAPVFHEGSKYWSCCCIRTMDFDAFLDQKGCAAAKHRWLAKQDKKTVACRHDWHQTPTGVVLSIYAKKADARLSCVQANGTLVSCRIHFEGDKIFKRDFHLWGVISVQQSVVNMLPSKVEIALRKADRVTWGKLEEPNYRPQTEPEKADRADRADGAPESQRPDWDIIDDDDISDSDDEWADHAAPKVEAGQRRADVQEEQDVQNVKRKEVEEEMRRAVEHERQAHDKLEELKRQEEEQEEGYEEMPPLE